MTKLILNILIVGKRWNSESNNTKLVQVKLEDNQVKLLFKYTWF